MILRRNIFDIEIEVDTAEPNIIYFDENYFKDINEGVLADVKEFFYKKNKSFTPISLTWELTNKCNFKCPFCYINNDKKNKVDFVPFSKLKRIIDDLIEEGLLFACLTGGECMLHPNFTEIYEYLKIKGVIVSVFTNGSLIEQNILDLFRIYKPYKIEISIYGIYDMSFNIISGQNVYSSGQVLNNILELKKMGINVICKTPINSITENQIDNIRMWCEENLIEYYVSPELLPSYQGDNLDVFLPSEEIRREYKKREINKNRETNTKIFRRKRNFDCVAGKYSYVINSDFNISPCLAAYGINSLSFPINDNVRNAITDLKKTVDKEYSNYMSFCNGCANADICNICLVTQLKSENLKVHTLDHCKELSLYYD